MTATRKNNAGKAGTAKTVEAAMAAGVEAVETAVKAGAGAFKGYDELAGFGKDNVEAVMTSGAILAKGVQDINDVWLGLAQASV